MPRPSQWSARGFATIVMHFFVHPQRNLQLFIPTARRTVLKRRRPRILLLFLRVPALVHSNGGAFYWGQLLCWHDAESDRLPRCSAHCDPCNIWPNPCAITIFWRSSSKGALKGWETALLTESAWRNFTPAPGAHKACCTMKRFRAN